MKTVQHRFLPLLLALLASVSSAQNAQVQQQTRQLLDGLGLIALLDQAPQVLSASVDAEAKFRSATPAQAEAWRRELAPRLKPQQLQQDLVNYVAERYRADTFQRVEDLLQDPLAKRIRYFDLAMTQPGATKNIPAFLLAQAGPAPQRLELVEAVDAASATAPLAAVLQTGVSERARPRATLQYCRPRVPSGNIFWHHFWRIIRCMPTAICATMN